MKLRDYIVALQAIEHGDIVVGVWHDDSVGCGFIGSDSPECQKIDRRRIAYITGNETDYVVNLDGGVS
jgi:hypothetical protein